MFSEATGISSGAVPREIAPGVIWDDAAERRFVEAVRHDITFGIMGNARPRADAEKSAREMIEAGLHSQFISRELVKAQRCGSPDAKRALVAEWRKLGDVRAEELIRCAAAELSVRQKLIKLGEAI